MEQIMDFSIPRGEGDKLVLRTIARQLGLSFPASLSKRAIQFGSRIVKWGQCVEFPVDSTIPL